MCYTWTERTFLRDDCVNDVSAVNIVWVLLLLLLFALILHSHYYCRCCCCCCCTVCTVSYTCSKRTGCESWTNNATSHCKAWGVTVHRIYSAYLSVATLSFVISSATNSHTHLSYALSRLVFRQLQLSHTQARSNILLSGRPTMIRKSSVLPLSFLPTALWSPKQSSGIQSKVTVVQS